MSSVVVVKVVVLGSLLVMVTAAAEAAIVSMVRLLMVLEVCVVDGWLIDAMRCDAMTRCRSLNSLTRHSREYREGIESLKENKTDLQFE